MQVVRMMKAAGALAFSALALSAAPVSAQAPASSAPGVGVAAPAAGHALTKADIDAWLDGFMPYALRRGDAAGAVVVVVRDGQVLTQRGFGYSDVAGRRPVDPETTLFKQASVSKLMTWTAVMQMVQQGKIDLDADINTYLDFRIPPRDGQPITMRNLMTHTAGFDEVQRGLNSYDQKDMPPLGEAMKRQIPDRIYAPGTTPAYSNYGTALAGYVVERVSGEPYNTYVARHIYAPTGMTHSTMDQKLPARLEPLLASGYQRGSGAAGLPELSAFAPAGGMTASGADMGRFMLAHLDHGGPLMDAATSQLMQTSITRLMPPLNGMALGFYEQNTNGRRVLSHAGDSVQFHSQLWILPDEKTGIYMSMNAAGSDKLSAAIRTHLFEAFADRYFPGAPQDGRVDEATAREHARMMVGTYNKTRRLENSFLKAMELAGQYKVSLNAQGGLVFKAAQTLGGGNREWVEIEPFVWREVGGKMRLAAEVKDGKVVRIGIDSSSPYMLFDRAPWYSSTAWLAPAFLASMGVLVLTAASWPFMAVVRRRYGARLERTGARRTAYRLTRLLSLLGAGLMVGWMVFVSALVSSFARLNGELDGVLIALQIVTPLILLALVATALWNVWLTWTGPRAVLGRLWSVVVAAAAVVLLWIAVVFHLIGFGTAF